MNTKHTSWEIIPVPDIQIVKQGADHPAIGIWDSSTCTEIAFVRKTKSNHAQLISAAPDLLLSLQAVIKWIDCGCDPSNKSVESARAAITKATQ